MKSQGEKLNQELAVDRVPDTCKCEAFLGEHSHRVYMEKHTNSLTMNPIKTSSKSLVILPTQESVFKTMLELSSRLSDVQSMIREWGLSLAWLSQHPHSCRPDAKQRIKVLLWKSLKRAQSFHTVRLTHPTPQTQRTVDQLPSTQLAPQRELCLYLNLLFGRGALSGPLRNFKESQWTCKTRNLDSHCIFNVCFLHHFADLPMCPWKPQTRDLEQGYSGNGASMGESTLLSDGQAQVSVFPKSHEVWIWSRNNMTTCSSKLPSSPNGSGCCPLHF